MFGDLFKFIRDNKPPSYIVNDSPVDDYVVQSTPKMAENNESRCIFYNIGISDDQLVALTVNPNGFNPSTLYMPVDDAKKLIKQLQVFIDSIDDVEDQSNNQPNNI